MSKRFYVFVFIAFQYVGYTQENNIALKTALTSIENTYKIRFSYANSLVENKQIDKSILNLNALKTTLDQLSLITGLSYKLVSKNRYTLFISKEKKTICGTIFDYDTREVIPGVSILVVTKKRGITSDENGSFSLSGVHKNDIIQISFLGYKTLEVNASDFSKKCNYIYLQEETTSLEEIVVTNYLTNTITKTIDGAIVFKPTSKTVLPGMIDADIFLTTQQVPGILNIDETASGLYIRGNSPNQNLILFNKIRLFTTAHFFGAISAINPQIVDEVTVYKSASNVKYGNHTSGVIDITSDKDIPKKLSGSLGITSTHSDINLKIPVTEKLSLQLAGRRSYTDVFKTPASSQFSDKAFQHTIIDQNNRLSNQISSTINTDFYFYDYSTQLNYQHADDNHFSLHQFKIKNNLQHSFSSNEVLDERKDGLALTNEGYGFIWNKKWSENISHEIYTNLSEYNLRVRNNKFSLRNNRRRYEFIFKDNKLTNIDFQAALTHQISERENLKYGYQFEHNKTYFFLERENNFIAKNEGYVERNSNNTNSVFGEYTYQKDKDFAVNIGARTNHFSLLNKTTFEPRIFSQIKIFPKIWVNASFEKKQQNITKIEETHTKDFGLENEAWVIANGRLIPLLESEQYTFGALYKANNWTIDLELYKKKTDGVTSITSGFESGRGFYIGKGKTLGLDLLIQKKWRRYNSWISYHTGKTSSQFNGINNNKEFNGNFDVTHSFYWAHHLTYKKFNFSLGWTYRVGIPYTTAGLVDLSIIRRNTTNEFRLPDYHRLDFTANYNILIDRKSKINAIIGVSFLNLYNKRNIINRDYDAVDVDNPYGATLLQEDFKSLGFTPNLSLRVKF